MEKQFKQGQQVLVPCSVGPGPFPDENLVIIETTDGKVSGFISPDEIVKATTGDTFIVGRVHETNESTVVVRVPGSYFTTNGLANFSPDALEARA